MIQSEALLASAIRRVMGSGLDDNDLEEHLQAVAVRLIEAFPTYDTTRDVSVETYMYEIATNLMIDVRRRQECCPVTVSLNDAPEATAPNSATDRAVESLAEKILSDPSILIGRARDGVRVSRHPQLSRLGSAVRRRVESIAARELGE